MEISNYYVREKIIQFRAVSLLIKHIHRGECIAPHSTTPISQLCVVTAHTLTIPRMHESEREPCDDCCEPDHVPRQEATHGTATF